MPAIVHPTLIVGVGAFGRAVTARLDEDAGALPETERARLATVEGGSDTGAFMSAVERKLRGLLRAGASQGAPQLDLALVADTGETAAEQLLSLVHALSSVLANSFSVLFPPSLPAHQRTVWLNVILGTAALSDGEAGRSAVQSVGRLERWHLDGHPPSPCLSRIWLLPRQTTTGVLSDEDVQRSAYLFASTAYLSGQRQSDTLRQRLEAPRDPSRLLGTLSVAAADVPVGRVLEYCTWRTALSGLDLLARQAEAQGGDDTTVEALMGPLGAERWLWSFEEGNAARVLRERAVSALPKRVVKARPDAPSLFESGFSALERHELRLDASPLPAAAIPVLPDENDGALRAADLEESNTIRDSLSSLERFTKEKLSPSDALRSVGALHRGFGLLAERFEKIATEPLPQTSKETKSIVARGPAPEELLAAARRKPSLLKALPAALGLGLLVALAVAGLIAVLSTKALAPQAGGGPALKNIGGSGLAGLSLATVLLPAFGAGLLAASAWLLSSLVLATDALKKLLASQGSSQNEGPTSASQSLAASSSLALRRRRLARTFARTFRTRQTRLQALRIAVQEARQKARDELSRLGVHPGATPSEDAIDSLLPMQTPLHRSLFPASALPLLCLKSREIRDENVWAQRLLEAGAGDNDDDLPFCPTESWMKASRAQHALLVSTGPFAWPETGALLSSRVASFLREVPLALAFGLRPQREDGARAALVGEGELLAFAPNDSRSFVEEAQQDDSLPRMHWHWSPGSSARLVVLTTGSDFDAESVWRGLGK